MATVLLIDDDQGICLTTAALLRRMGHTVTTAGDGREGIELFQRQTFDLVITDMRMPGVDGHEVIRQLRTTRPTVGLIATAGASFLTSKGHLSAEQVDADCLLDKPYSLLDLTTAVGRLLEKR